jgi:hypothetical protein
VTEYRKLKDKDTWHWCKNCSNWPDSNYETKWSDTRPTTGELCDQCKGKEKNNDCTK